MFQDKDPADEQNDGGAVSLQQIELEDHFPDFCAQFATFWRSSSALQFRDLKPFGFRCKFRGLGCCICPPSILKASEGHSLRENTYEMPFLQQNSEDWTENSLNNDEHHMRMTEASQQKRSPF